MSLQPGDVIEVDGEPCVVGPLIGSGRTAWVHRLDHPDRRLVVKTLRRDAGGRGWLDPARFMAEADTLQRLEATERTCGEPRRRFPRVHMRDGSRCLFVMDHVDGIPLSDILGRTVLGVGQALEMATRLAQALEIAAAAGIRNLDVKYDGILWNPADSSLAIIDWNVVEPWTPSSGDWLDPDLALVAETLDRALLDAHVERGPPPDWSRPFTRQPDRWQVYLRVFQLAFAELLDAPESRTLSAFRARLERIAEALEGEPGDLLRWVVDRLDAARRLDDTTRGAGLAEALAFAELAANARSSAVLFRAREVIGQAGDLLSADGPSIDRIHAALDGQGEQLHVPPGQTIELHRLRRLAHTLHAALGAREALVSVRDAYHRLRWQAAGQTLSRLMRDFARHPTVIEELTPLALEAEGLALCMQAFEPLDRAAALAADDGEPPEDTPRARIAIERERSAHYAEALDFIEAGVAHLRRVPWSDALFARFGNLLDLLAEVRTASDAVTHRLRTLTATHGLEAEGRADPPEAGRATVEGGERPPEPVDPTPAARAAPGRRRDRRSRRAGWLLPLLALVGGLGWWALQRARGPGHGAAIGSIGAPTGPGPSSGRAAGGRAPGPEDAGAGRALEAGFTADVGVGAVLEPPDAATRADGSSPWSDAGEAPAQPPAAAWIRPAPTRGPSPRQARVEPAAMRVGRAQPRPWGADRARIGASGRDPPRRSPAPSAAPARSAGASDAAVDPPLDAASAPAPGSGAERSDATHDDTPW